MTSTLITNLQRFSIHDGPGIRTTVFLKGCPLRCLWCHNPETMDTRAEVMLRDDRCLGCDRCAPVCEPGIAGRLMPGSDEHRPDATCERCGSCADACPSTARERTGLTMSVDEVVAAALRDRTYYEQSGGGVTFSGGEPLSAANAGFTLEALAACRRAGLHTAVDTCGYADREAVLEAGRRADVVLYDLKIIDPDRHCAATGADNRVILDNLRALSAAGADVRIRTPLVPGFTADDENLEAVAMFAASLPGRHPVHLLPFHRIARDKYGRLGRENPLTDLEPPTDEAVAAAAERVRVHVADVRVGG